MKTTIYYVLIVFMLVLSACKKEQVNLPPITHPTKDTTVLVTPTGAVVYASDWLSPTVSNGGGNSGGNGGGGNGGGGGKPSYFQSFSVLAPSITQNIIENGVILAFCKLENDNGLTRSLPTTTMINNFISIWDFTLKVGNIQFIQTSVSPFGVPPISSKNKFRYVIIPSVKHLRMSKPLNLMTYDEVCELFNLQR